MKYYKSAYTEQVYEVPDDFTPSGIGWSISTKEEYDNYMKNMFQEYENALKGIVKYERD